MNNSRQPLNKNAFELNSYKTEENKKYNIKEKSTVKFLYKNKKKIKERRRINPL